MKTGSNNFAKSKLSLAITLAFPVCVLSSHDVAADQGQASTLEEITVTARRVTEFVQDVPTSITAISSDSLEALQINGFLSVGQTVPNVYIQKQGGSATAPQMQIRGVSNGSLNLQVDSGIGLYIDGVYLGRPGASAFDLADLQQVEVLRGPQGTLFGRNSTGGAINLITAKPTGTLGGKLKVGFGNYNAQTIRGSLNLPEVSGLAAKITVLDKESDGDVDNIATRRSFSFPEPFGTITTAKRGGDDDTEAFSIALSYNGIDELAANYRYDKTNWTGTKNFRQVGNMGPCVDFTSTTGECAFSTPGMLTEIHPLSLNFNYADKLAAPLETPASLDVEGHALSLEYALSDDLTIKYIFGHREYDSFSGGNQVWGAHEHLDAFGAFGTAGDVWTPLFAMRREDQKQDSHEIQLSGLTDDASWIIGAFHFEEEGAVNNPIFLFRSISETNENSISVAAFDYFVGQNVEVDNTSKALYAHLTYTIGDFDISGGIRRTEDEREELILAAGLYGAILPGNASFNTDGTNTDYDFSVNYYVNYDISLYYKFATGFVSGGTLMGNAFDKETLKSHEIGIKSDLLDNRLRVNAALFTMERKDTQIEGFTAIGYFMGKGSGVDSQGLELELSYLPIDGLTINFNYGYTDVDSSGDLRTFQPDQTAYLGTQYDFRLLENGIAPSIRLDVSWRDEAWRLACPAGSDQTPATDICVGTVDHELDEKTKLDANTQVNLVASLDSIPITKDIFGKISIWGRNLLDEDNKEYAFTLGNSTMTSTFIRPLTYGIDFEVNF